MIPRPIATPDLTEPKSRTMRSLPLLLLVVVALNFYFLFIFSKSKNQQILMERARLSQTAETEELMVNKLYNELEVELKATDLGKIVEMSRIPGGIGITLSGVKFFAKGQIDLREGPARQLALLASFLADKRDYGFWLVVEGHTDDSMLNVGDRYIRTNWELSGARAADALSLFLEAGFPQNRALLMGFGDSRPAMANRDDNGKPLWVNQGLNRRVVVKLLRPSWLSGIF